MISIELIRKLEVPWQGPATGEIFAMDVWTPQIAACLCFCYVVSIWFISESNILVFILENVNQTRVTKHSSQTLHLYTNVYV